MRERWRFEHDSRPRHGGENEDSVFCAPVCQGQLLFAAVADGVGGQSGGARAARRAVQLAVRKVQTMRAADALDPGIWRMVLDELHGRLQRERGGSTTLSILATDGTRWAAAWVGDSKVYRVAGTAIECVSDGPERTGYLGGDEAIPRSRGGEMHQGERLAVLTDGLWKYVPGETFRGLLASDSGHVLTRLIAEVSRRNGGKLVDDASGVVVEVTADAAVAAPPPSPAAEEADDEVMWIDEDEPDDHIPLPMSGDIAVTGEAFAISLVLAEDTDDAKAPGASGQRATAPRTPAAAKPPRRATRKAPLPPGVGATRALVPLGLDPLANERLVEAIRARARLIVIAGPARSGLTTTCRAVAEAIQDERGLEPRSRYELGHRGDPGPEVVQAELDGDRAAATLLKASAAGREAVGALQSPCASLAIATLASWGMPLERVAATLSLVHAQRLLKRLCTECREPYPLPEDEALALGLTPHLLERLRLGFLDATALRPSRPRGCAACGDSGYTLDEEHAHALACESLRISDDVRAAILRGAGPAELERLAHAEGMWTLRESALRRALLAETSLDEVRRVIGA